MENTPYVHVPYPECPVYFEHKDITASGAGVSDLDIKEAADYESE